ncbi:PRC-barrel domain-containing protein [Catenuloplanes indicus]|uniref:Sporulation protein YlmC with PRC-barrel domain n=1 Tax=Catenuloplanes indicus TaxID=137267 RepID=A0AAE3VWU4_9ACTN|nr:PRC-barrel domain-containing protein [Catenuloplanes indicus]MDQ0365150.1 sporulation protein YlmC with PRC-barrel domain [Catenuloplanes indicus]
MTRYTDIHRRPIVDTGSATTVAEVDGIVIDPATATVAALGTHGRRDHAVVHWPDITGVGDAVTVASSAAVRTADGRAAELSGPQHDPLRKRLLTEAGNEIGRVVDIDFDPRSGRIVGLMTESGTVDGERLIGCGSYAVVVRGDG